jgi:hypothetical protein
MEQSGSVERAIPHAARVAVVSCCLVLLIALPGQGFALFSSTTAPVAMSVSTATLAAPTGLNAIRGICVPAVNSQANLSWTATASTFADGYEIARSTTSGGPYSTVGNVNGLGTVTHIDTGLAFSTTYYYVVRAKKYVWRSVNSAQSSVTTPNSLCL